MEDHTEVIMNCYKKFPHLRFGQFLINTLSYSNRSNDYIYNIPDRDLADCCKRYAKDFL